MTTLVMLDCTTNVRPVPVTVSKPLERDVTDYADFTGRTAAVDSVEVRARVWGYLDKVNFKEGVLVKKGDVLFEIDPRTYKTALANARRCFLKALELTPKDWHLKLRIGMAYNRAELPAAAFCFCFRSW